MQVIEIERIVALRAEPSKLTGGLTIYSGDLAVLTIEPLGSLGDPPFGSEEQGQHYLATVIEGPNAGRQLRLVGPGA